MPQPRINPWNFAINCRCYDPSQTASYYNASMLNNTTYDWSTAIVNTDTSLGMPSFHENRYVGRAAFTYSF